MKQQLSFNDPPLSKMAKGVPSLRDKSLLRHFLYLFLPLALLLTTVTYILVNHDVEMHIQKYIQKEEASLQIAASTTLRDINTVLHDIRYLGSSPAIHTFLIGKNSEDLERLNQNLLAIARSTTFYAQIRFLDPSGMELSRVNGPGLESRVVLQKALQHKGHRYYVAEGKNLNPGDIYISYLDLNQEHGSIEMPPTPVIRFVTAIADNRGERQGFLVFNYLAEHLLQNLRDITKHSPGNFLFFNQQGDFVLTPDPGDSWGSFFGMPDLFASRHPQVWQDMQKHDSGVYQDESGLYIYKAVYPRWYKKKLLDGSTDLAYIGRPPADFESLRWLMVSSLSPAEQKALFYENIEYAILLYSGLLLILTIGCLLISKGRVEKESETTKNMAIANATYEAIIMMDHEGKVSFWNPAAERIFGYSAKDAMGREIHGMIAPERYREPFEENFPEFSRTGKGALVGLTKEIQGLRKNNEEFPLELSLTAVRINNKWQGVALVRDISERKQAEQHLRKLSLAVEESPVSIIITNRAGKIEYVNPKFCEVSQYSEEEAVGANPRILKSEYQSPQHYQEMWTTIMAGHEWHGEFANRKKNGELYWERASISPLRDPQGNISHFVAIKEDISREKEVLENLKRAKEEAETANRAKSDFVANMSHEIRDALNAIIGLSELAAEMDSGSETKGYFSKIHQAGRSLLAIINDILDFSKIEAGELFLSPRPFDLNTVIDGLATLFSSRMWEKDLELLFRMDDKTPAKLIGDEMRLSQVLINFIGNALKFTEEGEIRVTVTPVSQQGSSVLLQFSVQDTGIGIREEILPELFSPFQQADSSISRHYGGTGLGLTICRQLVELMGGEIEARSAPGRGSTFAFTLPFEEQQDRRRKQKDFVLPESLQQARVLVADDNETIGKLLSDFLVYFSLRPTVVSSGQAAIEALAEAAEEPFSLLIIDWQMPDMDGLAACDRIRTNPATSELPIILMSGWNPQEFAREAQGKVNALLSKPVTAPLLFQALMDTLTMREKTTDGQETESEPTANTPSLARLLLVEDNAINLEVAERILSKAGYLVTLAHNGKEAVDAFAEQQQGNEEPFAAILMDIQMPEMSGYEATGHIRDLEQSEGDSVPIIAMTAQAFVEDREKCLAAGMDDFISKPIDRKLLLSTIARHLGMPLPRQEEFTSSQPATVEPRKEDQPPIDFPDALARLGGKADVLHRLLQSFSEEFQEAATSIRGTLEHGKMREAVQLAHTISGTAANLGAIPLSRAAKELQIALEKEEAADSLLTTFEQILAATLEAIEKHSATMESLKKSREEEGEVSRKMDQHFEELISLLSRNSYTALDKAREIHKELPQEQWSDQLRRLLHHVENFHYQEALELTLTLRKKLGQKE